MRGGPGRRSVARPLLGLTAHLLPPPGEHVTTHRLPLRQRRFRTPAHTWRPHSIYYPLFSISTSEVQAGLGPPAVPFIEGAGKLRKSGVTLCYQVDDAGSSEADGAPWSAAVGRRRPRSRTDSRPRSASSTVAAYAAERVNSRLAGIQPAPIAPLHAEPSPRVDSRRKRP